ncbi:MULTISPECIES: hypothetical protein [unclassified Breznakia]|uniref:hypothetical protein n=1 Tax=unclassified Breznakia TaxID=2623764 RepID=UPI002475B145|nr:MULTISPECIES: hypothetical protein [unclassified Breznakia]MDH6367064.1 hypothetical protein [Breznakia sp. PH1-1]MDH6404164.1 hypothetical protein [Breznakia sp. PF1-11]MDH6411951.1 hypothetical protein [Breznakia sp. PFB1-11]MDH6414152.1 hypothetical protein [Breznakia sp. PFB1-14]MDH6418905.1 hypothetical protein [Breznakia sp. PFB1-12]
MKRKRAFVLILLTMVTLISACTTKNEEKLLVCTSIGSEELIIEVEWSDDNVDVIRKESIASLESFTSEEINQLQKLIDKDKLFPELRKINGVDVDSKISKRQMKTTIEIAVTKDNLKELYNVQEIDNYDRENEVLPVQLYRDYLERYYSMECIQK